MERLDTELEARAAARIEALRGTLARHERAARRSPRGRARVLAWSLVLVPLLCLFRPSAVAARGPSATLVAGCASAGGYRLGAPGERCPIGPGDVVLAGPDGAVRVDVGEGSIELAPRAQLLIERLGPPSLRWLGGEGRVRGPLALATGRGMLRVPAGGVVALAAGERRPMVAASLEFRAEAGPPSTWTDADGTHAVPSAR